ncbi:MAG: substrate-binding domain-containing protein [Chloroflexi bacterium]|nr:substrate-binding domain-containing protein [Chloroflexota bacterium]
MNRRISALTAVLLGFTLVAGACGSDGDQSAPAATTAAPAAPAATAAPADPADPAAAGLARAQAHVDVLNADATSIGTDVPLTRVPDPGKRIVVLACNLTPCLKWVSFYEAAAAPLDWEMIPITFAPNPEDILRSFEQAVAEKPDGIIINGAPRELFELALPSAVDAGIPVVIKSAPEMGEPETVTPPFIAIEEDIPDYSTVGTAIANAIIVDSGGDANVVLFAMGDIPVSVSLIQAGLDEFDRNCPGCTHEMIKIQSTDIGGSLPSRVVSELQKNPDADYLVLQDGALSLGVAAALREAGLDQQVKTFGGNANPENLASLRAGDPGQWVQFGLSWTVYEGLTSLARHFNGDEWTHMVMPLHLLTADNISDDDSEEFLLYHIVADIEDQFRELWGVDY